MHLRPPPARQRDGGQGGAARATRRTSRSPRAAASRPPASASTTTPTARCRTRARSRACRRRAATPWPRPCRPAGTSPRATCDDGSPVSNIDVAPGRARDLHVHEPPAAARSSSCRTRSPTTRRTSPSPPAAACRPRSFQPRRRRRRHAVEHAHLRQRAGHERLLDRADPPVRAGSSRAHRVTTAARCPTSTSAPARPSPAPSTNEQARPDRGREGRDPDRPAGLLVHRRRRPVAHPASSSTTTPTARCRTRARSTTSRPAAATRCPRRLPSGWEQTGATCDDGSTPSNIDVGAGETVTCTFSNRKLGKIVVVKDAVPRRAAGLHVHAPAAA